MPGTIVGRHTTTEKTTQNTLDHAMSTDAPGSSTAVLDITTYAILAIAGFLSLLFVTVLFGTILFYCYGTKDKRRR